MPEYDPLDHPGQEPCEGPDCNQAAGHYCLRHLQCLVLNTVRRVVYAALQDLKADIEAAEEDG